MREPRGNFVYQKPVGVDVARIEVVREKCRELHELLEALPKNREVATAITKLEEVNMWANKGVVLG